jgi:hypothetical protein
MKLALAFMLACVYLYAQKYPGSVATDADMLVAQNSIKVKLQSAVSASDTTIVIAATPAGQAAIVANSVVSIDQEIMFVCAAAGNTLTIGTPVTCPSAAGRGFDGTTAAAHSIGPCSGTNLAGCVVGNVVAKHHNAMKDEIKAIESTLGPNLVNINLNQPQKFSYNYIFTPQSPGGSLIAGNNTITMTPVPLGVNGTDTKHYLYVSGGTGTAEGCLISGGGGTSGQASGQIIVNCGNAHSGAWTIQSANCGITEAEYSLATGTTQPLNAYGTVNLAAGSCTVYGPIPYMRGVSFRGQGRNQGTRLVPATSASFVFDANVPAHPASETTLIRDEVNFEDFLIDCSAAQTNTNFGIRETLAAGTPDLWGLAGATVVNVGFNNCQNSIFLHRGAQIRVSRSFFYGNATVQFTTPAPTTDTAYNSFEIYIDNSEWYAFCLNANTCSNTLGNASAMIACIHCEGFRMVHTSLRLQGAAIGITVGGASEGITMEAVGIATPYIALQFYPIVNQGTTFHPGYITLHDFQTDAIWGQGIQTSIGTGLLDWQGTHNLTITDSKITNPVNTTVTGINLQPYTRNAVLANNIFSNWQNNNTGAALVVGDHNDTIDLHNNKFVSFDASYTGGASKAMSILSTTGNIRMNENTCVFFDICLDDVADTIAIGATLTVPLWRNQVYITGGAPAVTTINPCGAVQKDYQITLLFNGAGATVTKGSNLTLTSNFGPVTTNGTLTLKCDGTNWREISRSVN